MVDVRAAVEGALTQEISEMRKEAPRFLPRPYSRREARWRRDMLEDVRDRLVEMLETNPDMPEQTRVRYNKIYYLLRAQIETENRLYTEERR